MERVRKCRKKEDEKKFQEFSLSLYLIKKAEKVKPTRVKTGELLKSGKTQIWDVIWA
jgi:hypothetical protein